MGPDSANNSGSNSAQNSPPPKSPGTISTSMTSAGGGDKVTSPSSGTVSVLISGSATLPRPSLKLPLSTPSLISNVGTNGTNSGPTSLINNSSTTTNTNTNGHSVSSIGTSERSIFFQSLGHSGGGNTLLSTSLGSSGLTLAGLNETNSNNSSTNSDFSSPITPNGPLVFGSEPLSIPLSHKNPNHASNAFDCLNKMRHTGQLCDVTIHVKDFCTTAHKVVLSAISPYFHAMFNDDLVERNQSDITIREIEPSAMQQLINYAYTGDITITEENVQTILPGASLLQMSLVREACCKFLQRQLHPTNCLGIRNFANTFGAQELQTRSHRFALQNFPEVMQTEEFLTLPLEEVEELLGSSQLNVTSEEQAYSAAMAWVKNDLENRTIHLSRLLCKVRIPLLSRRFLMTTVDSETLIKDDPGCKELLLEAMRYHLLPEERASLSSDRTADRRPDGMRPYIFAIGGGSLFAIHSECECYNPRTDRWMPTAPLLTRRSRCGVAAVSKYLFAVGGYDGTSDLATAEYYNPRTNKWAFVSNMGTRRSCLGVSALDGLIWAVGGYDGASCLNSVERFDPLTGVWSCSPALTQRRRYCRVATLDNCIYCVGGLESSTAIASVERLDPREGKWCNVPALSQRRFSAGLAALGEVLYCVGGSDGTASLATAEKFDPRRLRWESILPMHNKRSTHELVSSEGYLWALGGNDGSSSLSTMERYDPRLNKWNIVSSMLTRRSSCGSAVLDCLSMDKFSRC